MYFTHAPLLILTYLHIIGPSSTYMILTRRQHGSKAGCRGPFWCQQPKADRICATRWRDDQPTGNWIETEAQTTWSKQSILLESLAQGPVEGVESQIRGHEEVALCPTSKRIASKATTRVQARVPLNSLASRNSFLALRLWGRWIAWIAFRFLRGWPFSERFHQQDQDAAATGSKTFGSWADCVCPIFGYRSGGGPRPFMDRRGGGESGGNSGRSSSWNLNVRYIFIFW